MVSTHNQTDPRTEWLGALKAENCLIVRRMLRRDSKLLKVGWGEDLLTSEQPRGWNQRTALHVAARRGDAQLVEQILKILYSYSPGIATDRQKRGNRSPTDFKLLDVIDGDYDLNALAMAVVNGNQTIVELLKRTSRDCSSNPYDIRRESDEIMEAPPLDPTAESNISNITSKALNAISLDARKHLNKMYVGDCDFNFLKKNVYFFLFTFSTQFMTGDARDLIRPIQKEIFLEAQKHGLLEVLLSKLKDGQGRTALHVAVDSQNVPTFLELIRPGIYEGDENFLNVRDSAGRTPLYRAAAKNFRLEVSELLKDRRVNVHAEIKYEANRWGTGLDIDKLSRSNNFKSDCVYVLLEKLSSKGFNNKINAQAGPGPFIDPVTEACSTALHVSIQHKHERIVDMLLHFIGKLDHPGERYPACSRRYTWPIEAVWQDDEIHYDITRRVSTMNLAVLVGDISTLQHVLTAELYLKQVKPEYFSKCTEEKPQEKEIQSFLLAAAMGSPGCVKAFLDTEELIDPPSIKDDDKNTALHHALKGRSVGCHPHLIDFVGCQHVFASRWQNDDWISSWLANPEEKEEEKDEDEEVAEKDGDEEEGEDEDEEDVVKDDDGGQREDAQVPRVLKEISQSVATKDNNTELEQNYGQRQGSINLLLQSGMDLWEKNSQGRTCCPVQDAPKDFVTWWYEKVADETQQVQDKLSSAANAIAVTASLVATASYVGPLTPPLGYGEDPTSAQVGISAVRVFVIFDSLSFYFALCALVLSLIPALPLETESIFEELVRTRIVVAFAVTFLFPSIVCVLLAFVAGYAAVIPDHGLAYHGLTVATTTVGGFFCLIVMSWLVNRLFKVYKPIFRRLYNEMPKRNKRFKRSLRSIIPDIVGSLKKSLIRAPQPLLVQKPQVYSK